ALYGGSVRSEHHQASLTHCGPLLVADFHGDASVVALGFGLNLESVIYVAAHDPAGGTENNVREIGLLGKLPRGIKSEGSSAANASLPEGEDRRIVTVGRGDSHVGTFFGEKQVVAGAGKIFPLLLRRYCERARQHLHGRRVF